MDFGDGTVLNSCDFSIVVVTFGGTATPVTVLANGSAIDPDPTNIAFVGACRALLHQSKLTVQSLNVFSTEKLSLISVEYLYLCNLINKGYYPIHASTWTVLLTL